MHVGGKSTSYGEVPEYGLMVGRSPPLMATRTVIHLSILQSKCFSPRHIFLTQKLSVQRWFHQRQVKEKNEET